MFNGPFVCLYFQVTYPRIACMVDRFAAPLVWTKSYLKMYMIYMGKRPKDNQHFDCTFCVWKS